MHKVTAQEVDPCWVEEYADTGEAVRFPKLVCCITQDYEIAEKKSKKTLYRFRSEMKDNAAFTNLPLENKTGDNNLNLWVSYYLTDMGMEFTIRSYDALPKVFLENISMGSLIEDAIKLFTEVCTKRLGCKLSTKGASLGTLYTMIYNHSESSSLRQNIPPVLIEEVFELEDKFIYGPDTIPCKRCTMIGGKNVHTTNEDLRLFSRLIPQQSYVKFEKWCIIISAKTIPDMIILLKLVKILYDKAVRAAFALMDV